MEEIKYASSDSEIYSDSDESDDDNITELKSKDKIKLKDKDKDKEIDGKSDKEHRSKADIKKKKSSHSGSKPGSIIVEAIGPPNILKYKPETKKKELKLPKLDFSNFNEQELNETISDMNGFMLDFNVHINGNNECEFCGSITKPWPNIATQESQNPNEVRTFFLQFFQS
jgi:hypothetical protein